jgi:ubiquinone/menaquinone biosynthesis C-methylase UbiE
MGETIYDQHAAFYCDFVDQSLAEEHGLWQLLLTRYQALLAERLPDARVCDIACGEGYLSRFLARHGAREVIGIDISTALIEVALRRRDHPSLSYQVDDAQELRTISSASVDIAVCQMALMDIRDHRAFFRAVRRVLVPGGMFVLSLLHPCFQAPFHEPDAPQFLCNADGTATAVVVRRYASEGFWQSGGTGVRGRMGSYHRTLSTLLNDLLAADFQLERIEEPVAGSGGLFAEVPQVVLVALRAGA